jgi:hypothetical protein
MYGGITKYHILKFVNFTKACVQSEFPWITHPWIWKKNLWIQNTALKKHINEKWKNGSIEKRFIGSAWILIG